MDSHVEITENHIDIAKILAKKGVRLPKFLVWIVNKLLHVDEINRVIYRHRNDFGLDFVHGFFEGDGPDDLNINIVVEGAENIPCDGSPIVAGNHPLGGPDGMALMAAVGRYRTDIKFPVNDFLMYLPGPSPLFVPIDKVHHRSTNRDVLEEAFADNNVLLYFPAGLCSRKQKGKIMDLEWKSTVIKKAIKYQRDIVPVYLDARNRDRFYNLANLRKRLGIKFNFEMALLPAEMFAQRGKTFRVVFGKPIPYSTFDKRLNLKEWVDKLKEHVYCLKDNPDVVFPY